MHRHGALPGPVLDTLFGQGAVHTLDADACWSTWRCGWPASNTRAPAGSADPLHRVPTRPRSGFAVTGVRAS
ncbi:hypothetical protein ACWDQL_20530 [Streptomyces olivaceus]